MMMMMMMTRRPDGLGLRAASSTFNRLGHHASSPDGSILLCRTENAVHNRINHEITQKMMTLNKHDI